MYSRVLWWSAVINQLVDIRLVVGRVLALLDALTEHFACSSNLNADGITFSVIAKALGTILETVCRCIYPIACSTK